ncbi:hypothetical protein BDZ85DRAFT_256040 [Elsinoe ampelina]|uniref:Mitochondrial adapter protein MCP1 transmembrane domain-containing protein n=1 Tax=Elsinoe ampelina TaxID=302913 RepID=A0A6A6GKW6_9PEZI|nr:hypothetical protein BDZ85DRAFT_256040 [Elsinoe ampelina]
MGADDQRSLIELEPSPVEDTPREQKDSYFAPPEEQSNGTTFLGMRFQRSASWYLIKAQKYSSYAFTAFLGMHITNTSIIPLITQSVHASEPYLLLTRPYYQSPIAEPLVVIAPLAVHIASGVALQIYRRREDLKMYGAEERGDRRKIAWPKMSGTSQLGYAMTWLLAGHIFINRILPLKVHGGSSTINLSYVSHAFAQHPAVSFAGFVALISVGVAHMTWGMSKWLGVAPTQIVVWGQEGRLEKKRRWWIVNGVAAAIAGLWMAGGLGVVGRGGQVGGWVGREYEELYKSIPIIGRWM